LSITFDDVELSPNTEPQPQEAESESVPEPTSSPRHFAESDVLEPASASRSLRRSTRIRKAVIIRTNGRIVGWNYTDERTQPRP